MHPLDLILVEDKREQWPFIIFNISDEDDESESDRQVFSDVAFVLINNQGQYVTDSFIDLGLQNIPVPNTNEKWSTAHQMSLTISSEREVGKNEKGEYISQKF